VIRRIVAVGGKQLDHPALSAFVLAMTRVRTPRVLFLGTASGDDPEYIARFHAAFGEADCVAEHLPLFARPDDVITPIERANAIVVGGGNTKNLLLVWREHGVDRALRAAYERGTVLTGWSAGCICWFEDGITDSYGPTLRPLGDGLGWLGGSACPHYDGEAARRPTYTAAVADGRIAPGYAADDAVALVFEDEGFVEAVTPRPDGRAFRVHRSGERELPVRRLPLGR
jgi:dipeptidase E